MSTRYDRFEVDKYDTFGNNSDVSWYRTPSGNRARYENLLSDDNDAFLLLDEGDLRPGQQLLPLTQDQEVQLQNVRDVLERCSREKHGY